MPTIRIDEEVFNGLKQLAEPFIDSPNAVVRRLLIEKGIISQPSLRPKTASGPSAVPERVLTPLLTPQQVYEQFLLVTLAENFAGRGDKRSVTKGVIERMVKQGFIGPADLELVATGETKAENTITWGRNALKNRALIRRGSKRGIWELTEEGRAEAGTLELPKAKR